MVQSGNRSETGLIVITYPVQFVLECIMVDMKSLCKEFDKIFTRIWNSIHDKIRYIKNRSKFKHILHDQYTYLHRVLC